MERVLPDETVKKRIADLAVGLAADCDHPEAAVQELMRKHHPKASTLPFVGFVSHDGQWVGGFTGYKDAGAFLGVVEDAEKSPILQATEAVRKRLAGLVSKAEKAAEKGDWKSVMKAGGDAAKTTGRCPERQALAGLVEKARGWAVEQFDGAIRAARAGEDLTEAKKALGQVKRHFSGEPEGAEAANGLKALRRLAVVVAAESKGSPAGIREKVAAEYEGTRWAALFERTPEGE